MKPKYRRMLRGMKVREEAASYASADAWFLYILRCGDGSLYTGVTTDMDRRFKMHQEGKASRYTRTHQPVELVYRESCGSRSRALGRECAVKSLPRDKKEKLIKGESGPAGEDVPYRMKTRRPRTSKRPSK